MSETFPWMWPLFTHVCLLLKLTSFSPFFPPVFLAGATVVCGVCSVLWVLSGPGVLFPTLFCSSSESGSTCGWWDGPQPGPGGGLQGASWWQLHTWHPAKVRTHGWQTHLLFLSLYQLHLPKTKWQSESMILYIFCFGEILGIQHERRKASLHFIWELNLSSLAATKEITFVL